MEDIYIVSGVRTAIGDFGGTLKDFAPATLGKLVIAEAVKRAGIDSADVQHVVLGQAIPSEPRDSYVARIAAVEAGLPIEAPALTVNRLSNKRNLIGYGNLSQTQKSKQPPELAFGRL